MKKLSLNKKTVEPQITTAAIEALAEYFTGPLVGTTSVCLNLSGPMRAMAESYYGIRKAVGIIGHMSKSEAVETIASSLFFSKK